VGQVAVIGVGNLGEYVIECLYERGYKDIIATRRNLEALTALKQRKPYLEISTNNIDAIQHADMVLVTASRDQALNIGYEIGRACQDKLVVSFAAATPLDQLEKVYNSGTRLARVMTGIFVANDRAGYLLSKNCTEQDGKLLEYMFSGHALSEHQIPIRTFFACDHGFQARREGVLLDEAVNQGMSAEQANMYSIGQMASYVNARIAGLTPAEIRRLIGHEDSFTDRELGQLERQGYFEIIRQSFIRVVNACRRK